MFPQASFATDYSGSTFPRQISVIHSPQPLVEKSGRLAQPLCDDIEVLLTKIKRKRFIPSSEQSASMVLALQATELLRKVVEYYAKGGVESLEDPSVLLGGNIVRKLQSTGQLSPTALKSRKRGLLQEATDRIQEVIAQVRNAGRLLQRSSAFRLLLMNVTRRVLCVLRDAAVEAALSQHEFDIYWHDLVNKAIDKVCNKGTNVKLEDQSDDSEEILHSSGDEADAAEWGYSGNIGLSNEEVVNNQDTSPASGVPLPRVHSIVSRSVDEHRKPVSFHRFWERVSLGISELEEEEFGNMTDQLRLRAPSHIYEEEWVLTYGCSHSTMTFLLSAAESKSFKVVILEGAPQKGAAKFAESLAAKGIQSRVLPDSSCFAVMSKASKVFIGAESVLANGCLLAPTGTHMVCLAAKYHAVPVVVVTVSLKMCPYYPSDSYCSSLVKISRTEAKEMLWGPHSCPHEVLPADSGHQISGGGFSAAVPLQVVNPLMECCPPSLLSLFVTDQGEFTPEDINRVIRENYSVEDADL